MVTADAPVVVGKTVDPETVRSDRIEQHRHRPVRARVARAWCQDAVRADDVAAERFCNRGGHHDAPADFVRS